MRSNQLEVESAIRVWAEYQIARKIEEVSVNGRATPLTDFDIGALSGRILDIFYAPA